MKGLILIPDLYKNKPIVLGRYMYLFNLIKEKMGFDIIFTNDYDIHKIQADVVMVFKSPQKSTPDSMRSLVELPKDIKLITYYSDIHGDGQAYKKRVRLMMRRADKILCPYDYSFRNHWQEFLNKYEFFPQFFAPFSYYDSLKYNESPKMACLLSGDITKSYPLRQFILRNIEEYKKFIDYIPHPYSNEKPIFIGVDYVSKLNEYFCCVATASKYNYSVAKYFEIPAAGSLLLAESTPDLKRLGLIEGEHYVAITKGSFFEKVTHILKYPYRYEFIRQSGRKFVLENFSEFNRYNHFVKILKKLFMVDESC